MKFHGLVHGMHGMHHVQDTKLTEGSSSPPPPRGPVQAVGDGTTFIIGQVEEFIKPHVKDLPLTAAMIQESALPFELDWISSAQRANDDDDDDDAPFALLNLSEP